MDVLEREEKVSFSKETSRGTNKEDSSGHLSPCFSVFAVLPVAQCQIVPNKDRKTLIYFSALANHL